MMWWNEFIEPEQIITVDDMAKYAEEHSTPLLSNWTADYWSRYRSNVAYFDEIFRRRYRSFAYYMQDHGDTVADVTADFTSAVYGVLLKNDKKYAEMYRVYSVDDEDYSIMFNYDMTEHMQRKVENDNVRTHDEYTDEMTDTKDGYTDTNTKTLDIANHVTTDNSTITTGQQTTTDTNEVSAFNQSTYDADSKLTKLAGQREDTDNKTITEEGYEDTIEDKFEAGLKKDTVSTEYGQRKITDDDEENEEYTLTRKGNIGTVDATDLMKKAWDAWNDKFNFYDIIFSDIANELLRL